MTKRRVERGLQLWELELWDEPVNGAELLDELEAVFRRYVVLPQGAPEAMTLWVPFAHTFGACEVNPRLALISPTYRCGKTTALSILKCLVPRPLPMSNISSAAMFRLCERDRPPTFLIDEADTFLDGDLELMNILVTGHSREMAFVIRTGALRPSPTWAPIALGHRGKLPSMLDDCTIVIPMRRQRADEKLERLRPDRTEDLKVLPRKAARWAKDNFEPLRKADPEMPNGLDHRAADNWRPLLAIADQAGGHWPEKARGVMRRFVPPFPEPIERSDDGEC